MTAPVDIGTLIVSTPGYCVGRPRIADTRMPVTTIAPYWKSGYTAEDIVNRAFPDFELGPVHAALAYYFSNQRDIDALMLSDEAEYNEPAARQLREGGGPSSLSAQECETRAEELDEAARVLRSRLS